MTIRSATLLALGDEVAENLTQVLNGYKNIQEAWDGRETVATLATDDPDKRKVVEDFLRGEMLRQGLPVTEESRRLLEADKARDELNAATGSETERLILQQRFIANEQQRDFPRDPKEQRKWEQENAEIRREAHREFGPDAILDFEKALRETQR